eukprot:scaffold188017_cov24-Tisochrysis_lutea.AAC.1
MSRRTLKKLASKPMPPLDVSFASRVEVEEPGADERLRPQSIALSSSSQRSQGSTATYASLLAKMAGSNGGNGTPAFGQATEMDAADVASSSDEEDDHVALHLRSASEPAAADLDDEVEDVRRRWIIREEMRINAADEISSVMRSSAAAETACDETGAFGETICSHPASSMKPSTGDGAAILSNPRGPGGPGGPGGPAEPRTCATGFVPSPFFMGQRSGFTFKLGDSGLGYYCETSKCAADALGACVHVGGSASRDQDRPCARGTLPRVSSKQSLANLEDVPAHMDANSLELEAPDAVMSAQSTSTNLVKSQGNVDVGTSKAIVLKRAAAPTANGGTQPTTVFGSMFAPDESSSDDEASFTGSVDDEAGDGSTTTSGSSRIKHLAALRGKLSSRGSDSSDGEVEFG